MLCFPKSGISAEYMAKKLFNSEYQPAKRGQDKRTLILDAIKQAAVLNLPEDAERADIERAFFASIAKIALTDDHKDSGVCKQALLDRGWAKAKPEATMVLFDFNPDATSSEQALSIIESASQGLISVEDAGRLIGMIKDSIAIHESTELADRLTELEKSLNKG